MHRPAGRNCVKKWYNGCVHSGHSYRHWKLLLLLCFILSRKIMKQIESVRGWRSFTSLVGSCISALVMCLLSECQEWHVFKKTKNNMISCIARKARLNNIVLHVLQCLSECLALSSSTELSPWQVHFRTTLLYWAEQVFHRFWLGLYRIFAFVFLCSAEYQWHSNIYFVEKCIDYSNILNIYSYFSTGGKKNKIKININLQDIFYFHILFTMRYS